jgi:hypothetical protein
MSNLAGGDKSATFGMPRVSDEKWDAIFNSKQICWETELVGGKTYACEREVVPGTKKCYAHRELPFVGMCMQCGYEYLVYSPEIEDMHFAYFCKGAPEQMVTCARTRLQDARDALSAPDAMQGTQRPPEHTLTLEKAKERYPNAYQMFVKKMGQTEADKLFSHIVGE